MARDTGADRATGEGRTTGATRVRLPDGVLIRELRPDDAAGVVDVLRLANPFLVVDVASFRHRLASIPDRAQHKSWVALDGSEVVGYAIAGMRYWTVVPDSGMLDVSVLPEARRRGIGTALFDLGFEHVRALGPQRVWSVFTANDDGDRFARGHGFEPRRFDRISAIDPRTFSDPLPAIEGFRAVALAEFRDRPREIFEVEADVVSDIPLVEPFALDYDDWLGDDWTNPLFDFELGTVVLHGDRPVAFAQVRADRESGRAQNNFTASRRTYRGRGLATFAKIRSLHAAAAAGITLLMTENDERNAPMLAVNERLGYRPVGSRVEWCREL